MFLNVNGIRLLRKRNELNNFLSTHRPEVMLIAEHEKLHFY